MHTPIDIAWQRTVDRQQQLVDQARWHRLSVRRGAWRPAHLIRSQR
jgi:hypothetical protein